ncbi:rab proteins geranylgeranyltransferase component A [Scaptodrosophila lebanonensis]|uniref:Rab proteins geranylgeranyltransferase component A n=1 Tax=Drosophila lebanonensis TaxID=7225 RepID=A0A6J2U677_DROLE|nr:rab proteins geranylgeranyltransferase component A [Scaptodrosophila lebanonensis]
MSDELPEDYDLIVIGTGFVESCIAAAASRIGKNVLHIDANEYYGDVWSSFNLDALINLLEQRPEASLRNATYRWHDRSTSTEPISPSHHPWTREALLAKSRRFSIDLCPRILYAAGQLVQLLIKSNICRYAEFRALDHVCMRYNEEIVPVPCSRSDVFNTKALSIVEKRLLMKFLNGCQVYNIKKCNDDTLAFRGKTFQDYLQSQRVTEKIASCIMQSIALSNVNTSFEEGMERTQRFLRSLGRYGNTPFLFPMYGCGELPQCFCRLCAVYGGIYCLKRAVDNVSLDADTNEVLLSSAGKTLRAKNLVCAFGQVPSQIASNFGELRYNISRAVYITAHPLGGEELNKGGGGVNMMRLLTDSGDRDAIFIQLSHYSGTCPEGLYIFHLTTPAASNDPADDLSPFTAQIFQNNEPEILFSSFFTITSSTFSHSNTSPIFCTDAPSYELDYDAAIANARDIFGRIYAGSEFLPRAPDPEEIVVDGEDPSALSEHNLPDDLRSQLHDLEHSTQLIDIGE